MNSDHAPAPRDETLELQPAPVVPNPTLTPAAGVPEPPALHHAHRRPLGLEPLTLLGGLGILALAPAVLLLATGSVTAGLIVMAVAVGMFTLFVGGVRENPDARAARLARRTADRSRARAGVVTVTVRTAMRTALGLVRLRGRRYRLNRELKLSLAPLGDAVHHQDDQRAEELGRHAAQLEHELGETERQASEMLAVAREEIEHERALNQPTQAFTPAPTAAQPAREDPPQS